MTDRFMQPQVERSTFWVVETDSHTELVPADLLPRRPDPEDFEDYIEGTQVFDFERRKGWFAHLTAPGYLDATDWLGPFGSRSEAEAALEEMYE